MSERMDSMPRAAGLRVNRRRLRQFGTARSTRADADRFSSPPTRGAGEEGMSTSGTMMPGGAPEKPDRDDGRALLQHLRAGGSRRPLLHSAASAARPRRGAAPRPAAALLRAARAAADGEDLGPAGVARPAERGRRASLRVRQCRDRADRAGRRGRGDADDPGGDIRTRARRPRRRLPGRNVGADAGARRSSRRPAPGAWPVVPERPQASRAPSRRDRRAGRRHADLGTAPASRGVRHASRGVPAERGPVRHP